MTPGCHSVSDLGNATGVQGLLSPGRPRVIKNCIGHSGCAHIGVSQPTIDWFTALAGFCDW
jgi:hypothetical protein